MESDKSIRKSPAANKIADEASEGGGTEEGSFGSDEEDQGEKDSIGKKCQTKTEFIEHLLSRFLPSDTKMEEKPRAMHQKSPEEQKRSLRVVQFNLLSCLDTYDSGSEPSKAARASTDSDPDAPLEEGASEIAEDDLMNKKRLSFWNEYKGFIGKERITPEREHSWIGCPTTSIDVDFQGNAQGRRRPMGFDILEGKVVREAESDAAEVVVKEPEEADLEPRPSCLEYSTTEYTGGGTTLSHYRESRTVWPDEFELQFKSFAAACDDGNDGTRIALCNVDKWLEKANVLDYDKVTLFDTGMCFAAVARNSEDRKTLSFDKFLDFLKALSKSKQLELSDLINQLTFCGEPIKIQDLKEISEPPKLKSRDLGSFVKGFSKISKRSHLSKNRDE